MTTHINLLARQAKIDGTVTTVASRLSGSPVFDSFGRLLIERASANQLPNPSMSGAATGTLGSGGALPTSYARTNSIPVDVLPAPAGILRHRVYRFAGTPSTPGPQISATPTTLPGVTPTDISRGGIAATGYWWVPTATANVSYLQITIAAYDSGATLLRRADYTLPIGGRPKKVKLWIAMNTGETVHLWWAPTVDPNSATRSSDNFSATIEVSGLQLESASGPDDTTSFITAPRSTPQTCTVLTGGAASVLLVSQGGANRWVDTAGDLTLPTDQSYAVEQIHVRPTLTLPGKDSTIDRLMPVAYDYSAVDLEQRIVMGRLVQIQRAPNQYCFGQAMNRQQARVEIRTGDRWPGDDLDSNTNQRTEVLTIGLLPPSGDVWLSQALYVEPSAAVTAFAILWQFFTSRDPGDDPSISGPTVSMQLLPGDVLNVYTRGDPNAISTSRPPQQATWTVNPLPRGVWHRMVHRLTFSVTGGGHLKSWLNGALMYDADTPLGYNNLLGCAFKYGIYRGVSTDTLAARHANIEVGVADLSDRVANPLPLA